MLVQFTLFVCIVQCTLFHVHIVPCALFSAHCSVCNTVHCIECTSTYLSSAHCANCPSALWMCAPIECTLCTLCTLGKCAAVGVGSVTLLPAVGQLLARPQLKAELARPQLPHPPIKFARSLFSLDFHCSSPRGGACICHGDVGG